MWLVELGKTIRFSKTPTCQLYTGYRGGGKSKVEVGVKEFAKITASIRTQPTQRAKLRELLNPYTKTLVDALNEFIADAKRKSPQDK